MRTLSPHKYLPLLLAAIFLCVWGCAGKKAEEVVLYTSQDQWLAEPILADFERETGIRVLALYDAEAVKTVGLANRLRAEKSRPHCDLFWSNEELGLRTLVSEGIILSNSWQQAGGRSRVLLVNTNRVKLSDTPISLFVLADPKWKGRVAMAYPEFGTTRFHMGYLRLKWGDEAWGRWLQHIQLNEIRILDGNSAVASQVGSGVYDMGLTDSDDAEVLLRKQASVAVVRLVDENPLIFATLGKVVGRESKPATELLQKYLASAEVIAKMVKIGGLQFAQSPGTVAVEWPKLMAQQESTITKIREVLKR